MPFRKITDPTQLAVLIAALEAVCIGAGIEPDTPERDETAAFVMSLYWKGHRTADDFRTALNEATTESGSANRYGRCEPQVMNEETTPGR